MAEVTVYTDKTKEAVYEYSTSSSKKDLSLDPTIVVELFYNRGKRQMKFSLNGQAETVSLMSPKKPDSTPIGAKPKKTEVKIKTEKSKEAIYEYSTAAKLRDLSLDSQVNVYLFYNRGNRQLQINKGRTLPLIPLKSPKKPESTPIGAKKKK